MTKGLLLDFDDTILATTATRRPLLDDALRGRGASEGEIQDMHSRWGLPLRDLVSPIVPSAEYGDFVKSLGPILAATPPRACSGVEPLLRAARDRDTPVVVVTSSETTLVRHDLGVLGIDAYIDEVFGSDRTAFHKPDPRVFQETEAYLGERYGVAIDDCIYIGDGLGDAQSSRGVCAFTAVLSGSTSRSEFLSAGVPDHAIYQSLDELAGALWATV